MAFIKSKEQKESQQQNNMETFKNRYNIDSLDAEDVKIISEIAKELYEKEVIRHKENIIYTQQGDRAKVTYFGTLVEQNWLIINQLAKLNQKLDKMMKE